MSVNQYRGEVLLAIAGKQHAVRYTWDGIARLKAEFGAEWDAVLSTALASTDLDVVAKFLAIGLRESWPDVTAADVASAEPPIRAAYAAINQALNLTFHGTPEAPAEPVANPPAISLWSAVRRLILFWKH